MSKEKNETMNIKFNELNENIKMEILDITDDVLNAPRFRGIDKQVVINDIWFSKTNAQKRSILKNV